MVIRHSGIIILATQRSQNKYEDNIRSFPGNGERKLSLGKIITILILIYVIIVVFLYFHSNPIVRYEVVEGALSSDTIYRAVCMRDEQIATVPYAGYVNYLAREGQRVRVGDMVYMVDETGLLNEYLEQVSLMENSLTDSELSEFRDDIINFTHSYDATDYDTVYDFKYTLKNTVLKLSNTNLLNQLNLDTTAGGSVQYVYSTDTGIVTYWIDGYEDLTDDQISESVFDESDYDKNQMLSNQLRASGDAVYKLCTDENWSVVIPATQELAEDLLEKEYVKVRFLKDDREAWGKVSVLNQADDIYVKLSFTNSMIAYASERYLDIELLLADETGLKIPVSSIVEKEFFTIDDTYIFTDDDEEYYVIMLVFDESGNRTSSKQIIDIYSYNAETHQYYVDDTILSAGDILYTLDNQNTYVVKTRGTLIGVYNINKGFADFKEITILYQNDEYAIVKSNTKYGLRVYDYIALDASTIADDQFINQ